MNFRFELFSTIKELNDIQQGLHPIDFQIVDHSSLVDVVLRHYQPLEFLGSCTNGDGQGTTNRL